MKIEKRVRLLIQWMRDDSTWNKTRSITFIWIVILMTFPKQYKLMHVLLVLLWNEAKMLYISIFIRRVLHKILAIYKVYYGTI